MSGKKGMKKYPMGIREEVVARIHAGDSQCALSREYGISRMLTSPVAGEPLVPGLSASISRVLVQPSLLQEASLLSV